MTFLALVAKNRIMDAGELARTLRRMAHEIVEREGVVGGLALVGIRRRGVPLAERLAQAIAASEGEAPPVGVLDITFYRDDLTELGEQPLVQQTEIPFPVTGRRIVLVDDVLYTGRTVRAALDALIDLGRPRLIQLAVLIDRGHRELPLHADYIGREVPTTGREVVEVHLSEVDGSPDEVWIMEQAPDNL